MILGIASIFVCAPITAPPAIWKASKALRVGSSVRAIVAIVLSLIGIGTSALFWFLTIWQLLSPAERVRPTVDAATSVEVR